MAFVIASNILHTVDMKQGSIKSLIHRNDYKNKKQIYALVCETLRYQYILDELIEKTSLQKYVKQLRNDAWLSRVLVYALVFGKGLYGKQKDWLSKHKSALTSELVRMKIRKKVVNDEDLLGNQVQPKALPRYVRINTLKSTINGVICQFKEDGFTLIDANKTTYKTFVESVQNLKGKEFIQDINMRELLIFAPSTDLHSHSLYTSGQIILQDKASCMPAFALGQTGVESRSHAIDSCAAPGNKTSHLAAIMENKGKIFAFDKDGERLKTMNNMLLKAGASCVTTCHKDFLKTDPSDAKYKNVRYAIVDPSCSGSGIVSRMNALTDDQQSYSKERLQKLSQFQRHVLAHALSFPTMQRVVYSTCSVHEQENEQVVEAVYEKVEDKYDVIEIVPEIPSRGLDTYIQGPKCLRLGPATDLTNGFFIACFQRKESSRKTKTDVVSDEEAVFSASQCTGDEKEENANIFQRNQESVELKNVTEASFSSHQKPNKKRKRSKKGTHFSDLTMNDAEKTTKKESQNQAKQTKFTNNQVHCKPNSCQDLDIKEEIKKSDTIVVGNESVDAIMQIKKKQKKKKRNHKPVTSR